MRLWSMEDEVCILYVVAQCNMMRTWSKLFPFVDFSLLSQSKLRLLEEDNSTLETSEIRDNHAVLIEGW